MHGAAPLVNILLLVTALMGHGPRNVRLDAAYQSRSRKNTYRVMTPDCRYVRRVRLRILGVTNILSRALVIRQTGTVAEATLWRTSARLLCLSRNSDLLLSAHIHPGSGQRTCLLLWDRCRLQSGELLQ